jgi:hypothetical protein
MKNYWTAIQPLGDVDVGVVEKGFDFVGLKDEYFEVGEVSKHFDSGEFVAAEVKFGEFGELFVVEHVIEVLEFAALEFQFDDVLSRVSSEVLLENFFSEPSGKMLPGLDVFGAFDRNSIKDLEFFQQIKHVKSVAFFLGDGVA